MKMNMIISKKHIVLSALVLALSVAVYLNWEYVKINGDSFENTSKVAVEGPVDGVVDGMTAPARREPNQARRRHQKQRSEERR